MELSEQDILLIKQLIEESDFDELSLYIDGLSLEFSKDLHSSDKVTIQDDVPKPKQGNSPSAKPANVQLESTQDSIQKDSTSFSKVLTEEDTISVDAPMLGTFYRSPRPGTPPFVEIGSLVNEDDTLCLIEVMKVFSAVKAKIKGEIISIPVDNGTLVEYGQPLFLIKQKPSKNNDS
tara:strand:- start:377 stop:907 length:531 start_codon:yes stop_codon:yes gene_type:complete